MIHYSTFLTNVDQIDYKYDHPLLIYSLMRCFKIRHAIEIGCHIGYTSCWMARAIQENKDYFDDDGMLTCIDPFCWVNEKQEELWNKHIDACGVRDSVQLIKGRSQEVEWPKAELVFVDGNHTYPVAKHDTEMARDIGAHIIILHDTVAWEGSRRHSEELRDDPAWDGWDKMDINTECGMMILIKRSEKQPSWGEDAGEQWDKPQST